MTTLIGAYGALHEIRSPRANLPLEIARPSSETILLSGRRVAQRSPLSAREWKWKFSAADVDDLAKLIGLEQGVYGNGPWFWYDKTAAKLNMLDDIVAAAGMGVEPWRHLAASSSAVIPAGAITLEAGHALAYSIEPTDMLTVPYRQGIPDPIPAVAGRTYTAAGYITGGPGYVGLLWCDANKAPMSTVLSAHTTGRATVTASAPAGAHGLLMAIQLGEPRQALTLDGTTGTYATTGNHASLQIVGDLEVSCEFVPPVWPPPADQRLVAKFGTTSNQCSYQLRILPGGYANLVWSTNGSSSGAPGRSSTVPIPALAGNPVSIKATLDVDNGAGGHTVTFYTSPDFTVWTPLGDPVTEPGATSIHPGTASLAVGARVEPEGNLFTGRIVRAQVRNGIGGTIAANPNFAADGWLDGDNAATTPRADSVGRAWDLSGNAVIDSYVDPQPGRRIGALQVTETATAPAWHPGIGIPRVSIAGAAHAYRLITESTVLRDVDVTLTEVI